MRLSQNPFDLIRTEDFNSNYKILARYFSDPKASYYSNLARRGNVILTGTRGSGKTMLLKSLYLPVHIEILRRQGKDPRTHTLDFVGVLINCERYEFKIFRENIFDHQKKYHDEAMLRHFWKQCMGHYFALLIIEEMLNTVITNGPEIGLDFSDPLYDDLFADICHTCRIEPETSPQPSFTSLAAVFKELRKQFSGLMHQSILQLDYNIANGRFDLSSVIEVASLLKRIPRLQDARFYILLDDFFYPNLADEQQRIILELVRVRNEPLAFKIATLPGGTVFQDDSGFELMPRGDEFIIESIEYPDLGEGSDYYNLVADIVNNRLADYGLTYEDVFADGSDSMESFLAKLRGDVGKGHTRAEYGGFGTLVHLSSGIVRTFLVLAKKIVDEWLQKKGTDNLSEAPLPIPVAVQTTIVYKESSLFLDAIESRDQGLLISRLVEYIAEESRHRLRSNKKANQYIQLQISDYGKISPKAQEILTKAITANVFHSYSLSHRTTRRGAISIKSLVLNRLATPALRVPYHDRWTIEWPASKINWLLGPETPVVVADHEPTTTFFSKYCPVISGDCNLIDLDGTGRGCFYASPIRSDWTALARDIFDGEVRRLKFAIEYPPQGDLTCKICQLIHSTRFGIYEVTDLNENVVFELALALAREKYAFAVVNTELPTTQLDALLGQEYIPYQVVQDEIARVCREKVLPGMQAGALPWNANVFAELPQEASDKSVLLVMPRSSHYYSKTLTGRVRRVLEEEMGFSIVIPSDYSEGNWFRNLARDVVTSRYCLIDTTLAPGSSDIANGQFAPNQLDYLQRLFIFGLAVGRRKIILHGYNKTYNRKLFTDMQGHCHFEYADAELVDEVRHRVPEVFK